MEEGYGILGKKDNGYNSNPYTDDTTGGPCPLTIVPLFRRTKIPPEFVDQNTEHAPYYRAYYYPRSEKVIIEQDCYISRRIQQWIGFVIEHINCHMAQNPDKGRVDNHKIGAPFLQDIDSCETMKTLIPIFVFKEL